MRTPADRLREAREVAGFTGATEVAENFGWNKNTYKSHENGIRGISTKKARQYARGLQTTPEWILYERGPGRLNRVQKETTKDRILPDEETLELSIRQALRFVVSRDPRRIAKATMVLYKLLSERKRRGETSGAASAIQVPPSTQPSSRRQAVSRYFSNEVGASGPGSEKIVLHQWFVSGSRRNPDADRV